MRRFLKTVMAFSVVGAMCLNAQATNISDLQEETDEYESKKEEAQAIVDQLSAEQDNILSAIAELDAQVSEYNSQISELQAQKEILEVDIADNQVALEEAQAQEAEQYEAMKLRIQYSYESGDVGYMDTIFTASSVTDIVNESEYFEQMYNYDAQMLDDLIAIKTTVANKQLELETDLAAVEEIENSVNENKEALEVLIAGKEAQVNNYAASIEDYEDQVEELNAAMAELDDQIAAAEAANAAANSGSSGSANIDVDLTNGTFQWPVAGNYFYISSYFGPRNLAGTSYHHGLDIPCPTGTPILAGESGTVILATYNSSLGNYVCIDHGGGVTTTYGHNSSLAVSAGQYVNRGDVINGSYVDPYPYLY